MEKNLKNKNHYAILSLYKNIKKSKKRKGKANDEKQGKQKEKEE